MSNLARPARRDTDHTECHAASFTTTWMQPSIVVITAHGELDAANAQEFIHYALRYLENGDRLVLDLAGVTFFGTEAFSAIHALNVRCAARNVSWALVPSTAVTRLLRICDPDSALPVSDCTETALRAVARGPRPSLELVPQPR